MSGLPAVGADVPRREGDVYAGRAYAIQACASCHVVAAGQRHPENPPVADAPDFEAVANAKTTSAMGLQAFLVTPHQTMPNLILSQTARDDLIAYILSFRK